MMHNKLDVSYPVPDKISNKDAAESTMKTEKVQFKAAATAEQAMTKHMFPAKVKQATPVGSSVRFVFVSAALLCAATTALRLCQRVEYSVSFLAYNSTT